MDIIDTVFKTGTDYKQNRFPVIITTEGIMRTHYFNMTLVVEAGEEEKNTRILWFMHEVTDEVLKEQFGFTSATFN